MVRARSPGCAACAWNWVRPTTPGGWTYAGLAILHHTVAGSQKNATSVKNGLATRLAGLGIG